MCWKYEHVDTNGICDYIVIELEMFDNYIE